MEPRSTGQPKTMPLHLTRDEVYLLLVALQNVAVPLGMHERDLCGKIRDTWDALRLGHAERDASC
jgi:hypothetical protein